MRVSDSSSYRDFLNVVHGLNERLQDATMRASSGRRIVRLHDAPGDSVELVALRGEMSRIAQYRSNIDGARFILSVADSALSTADSLYTTIFTRGSAAASQSSASSRAAIAKEIRALRDEILGVANTRARGRYTFAGSKVLAPAFTLSGDTATYQGDNKVNQVQVSDSVSVQQGIDGGAAFSTMLANIGALVTAIDANDTAGIRSALSQVSSIADSFGQYRTQVGSELSRLDEVAQQHDTQQLGLQQRRGNLEDADIAEAVTDLTRIQTALRASMTAGSYFKRPSLFEYIG